jgi:hypothetical protein
MMEYVQFRIGFYQLIYFWVAAHTRTHIYIYYNIQYMLFIYRIEYAMIYLIVDDIWWNIISK